MSFSKKLTPNDENNSQVSYNRMINSNKKWFFFQMLERDVEENKGGL